MVPEELQEEEPEVIVISEVTPEPEDDTFTPDFDEDPGAVERGARAGDILGSMD